MIIIVIFHNSVLTFYNNRILLLIIILTYILQVYITTFYDFNSLWEGVLLNTIITILSTFSDSVPIVYDSNVPREAVLLSK